MSERIKGSSKLSLITLSVSYLFFIILIYMLVARLLSGLDYAQKIAPALVLFSILIPLTFIGIIAGKIVQLYADAKRGNSGQRYKAKIVFGFVILIILVILPQTGLTLIFIQKTANTWLPDETIPVLQESSNQILESYRNEVLQFQDFCENGYLISELRTVFTNPEAAWGMISFSNPSVKALQIYQGSTQIHALGDETFFYSGSSLPAEEMLARVNTGNETLIRYNRPFSYNGIPYSALLTAALSNHLINAAGPLSNLYTYYIELDFYKHNIIIYFTMILAIISFPLLLVIILLALYISESITRPILAIENASQSIMEGDLSVRIIEKENRDFNKIINSFNKMLSTVERKNEEKYESTKMQSWSEFALILRNNLSGKAEELLKSVDAVIQMEKNKKENNGDSIRSLEHLRTQCSAFSEKIDSLYKSLDLPSVENPLPCDLRTCLDEAVRSVSIPESKNIEISMNYLSDKYLVSGDASMLINLFTQLLKNSVEAIAENGRIIWDIDRIRKNENRYWRIVIQDDGKGVAPEIQDKIFQPYFTTKIDHDGMGLCLAERIVFLHYGQIRFLNPKKKGAAFYVDLPAAN